MSVLGSLTGQGQQQQQQPSAPVNFNAPMMPVVQAPPPMPNSFYGG
jgi:hypothetical protein